MDINIKKQAIKHIVESMQEDFLIIFVGVGASVISGLTTWNQLIDNLKEELDIEEIEDNLKIAKFYYGTCGQQKYLQKFEKFFRKHINAEPNDIHEHIFHI